MKVLISLVLFTLVISCCSASRLIDIRSAADSPHYAELMEKLHPVNLNDDPIRTGRITNGTLARPGQFPYQVYMYLYDRFGSLGLCGGSVIHKRWILTAAHCVQGIVKVEVYFGAINRRISGEAGAYIQSLVVTNRRSIISHARYGSTVTGNDIGLVELPADALVGNNYVGILALPTGAYLTNNFTEELGTVAGYGLYSDSIPSASVDLNYVTLPIAPNEECSEVFNSVRDSNICLRSLEGKSACNGDSGGALAVVDQNGLPMQVGIVSFGSAVGCQNGLPNVFTRVTSYMPWIIEQTGLSF